MRIHLLNCIRFGWQRRCATHVPEKWNSGNKGMNAAIFKSVFQTIGPNHPAAKLQQPKYRRRWDWHLRNLIYSLMPPAAAYGYILIMEWALADEVKEYKDMVEGKKEAVQKKEAEIEMRALTLAERLDNVEQALQAIEKERVELRKLAIVDAAKSVLAKKIKSTEDDLTERQ